MQRLTLWLQRPGTLITASGDRAAEILFEAAGERQRRPVSATLLFQPMH